MPGFMQDCSQTCSGHGCRRLQLAVLRTTVFELFRKVSTKTAMTGSLGCFQHCQLSLEVDASDIGVLSAPGQLQYGQQREALQF